MGVLRAGEDSVCVVAIAVVNVRFVTILRLYSTQIEVGMADFSAFMNEINIAAVVYMLMYDAAVIHNQTIGGMGMRVLATHKGTLCVIASIRMLVVCLAALIARCFFTALGMDMFDCRAIVRAVSIMKMRFQAALIGRK